MANTKQKIDRWSSSENTMLHVTQPSNNQTSKTELSAVVSSMSTNNDSHNDQ
jgi:hypothetical protein